MFNLIKMNFYRLFHQKSFFVCLAAAALTGWFMVFLVWMTPKLEAEIESRATEEKEFKEGFHVGYVGEISGDQAPVLETFNASDFMDEFLTNGIGLLLISVSVPLIVNADRKRGFIKNLGGQMKPRGMLALAKLPVILFDSAAIYITAFLSFALFGRIYYAKYTLGDISLLCRVLLVQLVLALAFGALLMLICMLVRSAAGGILAGVVASLGLLEVVYAQVSRFAVAYLGAPVGFDVARYSLDYYVSEVFSAVPDRVIVTALLAGAAYLILASAAGYFIMEKRDIA